MAQSLFLRTRNNIQKIFARELNKNLDIALIPYITEDSGYALKVTAVIQGMTAKLTDEERYILYRATEQAYNLDLHWILIDLSKNIYYKGKQMNSSWIKMIMPNILGSGMKIINDFLCVLIPEDTLFSCDCDITRVAHTCGRTCSTL